MKRTLGPVALTAIGIGAVIGAGIFSLTGTAAAGQTFASGLETPIINFIQAWLSGYRRRAWPRRRGPRHSRVVHRGGHRLRICGVLLRRAGVDDSGLRISVYLFLRDTR